MKTIIFAVAGYNLAETGRHIEIARACKDDFNVVFLSYGGAYEQLIEKEGFRLRKMEPRLTAKQRPHEEAHQESRNNPGTPAGQRDMTSRRAVKQGKWGRRQVDDRMPIVAQPPQ